MNSLICNQLNGFMPLHVILTFRFRLIVKSFQVSLIKSNNSIQHYPFVCSQLKYFNVSITIQLNTSHYFYTKLNDQTVLFITIQFNNSHLFAHSVNVKCQCSIWPRNRTLLGSTDLGQSGPESNNKEFHMASRPSDFFVLDPRHLVDI